MKKLTLKDIKTRLTAVIGQIANERLTGDTWTDYHIRYTTLDLCHERNSLKQIAWEEHGVTL